VLCGAGATARVKSALLELLPESLKLIFQLGSFSPAHWTAAATSDSVLGLERLSNKSSVVFRCRATRIPATIASTRLRPSSITKIDFHFGVGLSSAAGDHLIGIGYSFRIQAIRR
jgi:hypothetical protein